MMNLLPPITTAPRARALSDRIDRTGPAVCSDSVYVAFTSVDDTIAAARIARDLAATLEAPLTLVHVRSVPFLLPVDEPTGISPLETEEFAERLRAEGVDARVRVSSCRNVRRMLPRAFKPRSLIVTAGQHRWWPRPSGGAGLLKLAGTRSCSSRRPDTGANYRSHRRRVVLDLFYLAVGVVGLAVLWGIAKACDRA